jgi:hypothetical protein
MMVEGEEVGVRWTMKRWRKEMEQDGASKLSDVRGSSPKEDKHKD